MQGKLKLGLACAVKTSFDYVAAGKMYDDIKQVLLSRDDVEWYIWEKPMLSAEEAAEAGKYMASNLVDGYVFISGTFHLGHLPLILNSYIRRPVLFWAFDELPYNGGKIRLNSVCGINLNASNFYKAGIRGASFNIGPDIDEAWLGAMKMYRAIHMANMAIAGYSADGFFNVNVCDLDLYKNADILVNHYELQDLYSKVNTDPDAISDQDIEKIYCCDSITSKQTKMVAQLAQSMKDFMDENKIDALTVRCWPEFAKLYGMAPCAAMSYLQGQGYIIGCEGDLEGTLSMLATSAVADCAPFMADLSQLNFQEDYALMWHCGVAPYPLWDGVSERSLSNYRDGGKGMTADFVMKNGTVTFMRIDTANGKTRVFAERGTVIPMTKDLRGTYCKVRFEKSARELIDIVTSTGVAHHVSMIYGDHMDTVKKFAEIMDFEFIS